MLIRILQILAVVLIGLAAWFFSQGNSDVAFVTGVLAVCAFFLSIRFQLKRRIDFPNAAEENNALPDDDANG